MIFLLCSGCRTIYWLYLTYLYLLYKHWRFYFNLYYLYCLSIFQRTCASFSKAGAKVRGFILTTKLFRKFFYFFFLLISQTFYAKGKECIKEKTKAVFFANRTAKIRTLFIILQNFLEVFLFFSLSAISLFHYVNSARLSSLGKRVQKYALFVYNPNILNSFFEVFLKESAKTLKDNDVVEHIFDRIRKVWGRIRKWG